MCLVYELGCEHQRQIGFYTIGCILSRGIFDKIKPGYFLVKPEIDVILQPLIFMRSPRKDAGQHDAINRIE